MKYNKVFSYFLGFFWADGYLWSSHKHGQYRIVLENASEDLDVLMPYFKNIGHFVLFRRWRKNSTKEILRATMYSKDIYEYLMTNGFDDKLSAHTILPAIPESLHHYFWRGLFDGDGCFGVYQRPSRGSVDYIAEIVSDERQDWSSLSKICLNLDVNYTINFHSFDGYSHSSFAIRQIDSMIRWGEYIYQGYPKDKLGLPRKYQKFLQIKNH